MDTQTNTLELVPENEELPTKRADAVVIWTDFRAQAEKLKTTRELPVPMLTTEKGAAAMQEIAAKVEAFAAWVEKKAGAL